MNISVVDVSANQKKLQVEIPAEKVQEEIESRYKNLAKNVRIKGFRPGKVPRSILKSYYGKSIEGEVSSQLIQETFPDALRRSELKPLVQADVDEMHFETSGTFTYVAVIEVAPEFELGQYKGLEIQRTPIQVSDEKIEADLERLREQHAELRTLEDERPIREGDSVLVDFTPSIDGQVFEKGKTNDYMVEIGKNALHPDFDDKLIGHKAGDTLSFDLDYPADAQSPELAGKTVHFDLTVREIKEKVVPELNDEFAQTVGAQFETLDALKQEVSEQIRKREEERLSRETRQQITDKVLENTGVELSSKVIEREVDRMIRLLQYQFESQGLKVGGFSFDTPEIRAEYRPQAEKNIRWRIIAQRIAQQEGLELSDDEMEDIYQDVARLMQTDVDTLKREYADSPFVEETKENKIQDKVLKFLEAEASFVEAPEEEQGSKQE